MYVPLENRFLFAHRITKQELQPFSLLFVQCRHRVTQLPYYLGGWAWEFPGVEKDESERRVIQKVSQSEQQCCPLAELSLSFSVYLEMLNWWYFELVATDCHTTLQGLINFNLAFSLIRDVLGNVQEASGLSEIFIGLRCVPFPPSVFLSLRPLVASKVGTQRVPFIVICSL